MKTNRDVTYPIAKRITEIALEQFKIQGEPNQFTVQIDPLISNMVFNREKELLQEERFLTIIRLSKHITDEGMLKNIEILGYELTMKK
jgi:hypothetical protein